MILALDHKNIYIKCVFLLNHHNHVSVKLKQELNDNSIGETLAIDNSLLPSNKNR